MKKITMSLLLLISSFGLVSAQSTNNWKLIFEDNFTGSSFNTSNWTYCNRGKNWAKYMTSSNQTVSVANGNLLLKAIKNPDLSVDTAEYLAGGLSSRGKFSFKYGKIEVRVKLKNGQGTFPAIWMMPEDGTGGWPACGEIDIMEHLNFEPKIHHTIHSYYSNILAFKSNPIKTQATPIIENEYNIYGLEWYPDRLDFTVNGAISYTYPRITTDQKGQWPFDKPFYIILNQAAGGDWPGKIVDADLPFQMQVDWVKVYKNTNK